MMKHQHQTAAEQKALVEAKARALRAQAYANRFPNMIRNSDSVFPEVDWQYERELRYAREGN